MIILDFYQPLNSLKASFSAEKHLFAIYILSESSDYFNLSG
jgi:hypothetical protein